MKIQNAFSSYRGVVGLKCYQWSCGSAFAAVFIGSTIMCVLLKLGAKVTNRDVKFTVSGCFWDFGMYQKIKRI